MTTQKVHAFIVTDNLVELWYPNAEEPTYALHGDVSPLVQNEKITIASVWQRDGMGGLHGYLDGQFIYWTVFNNNFLDFLKGLSHVRQVILEKKDVRHQTGVKIHQYGYSSLGVWGFKLTSGMMDKLHMFINHSWMVNPHIPMKPEAIIRSLNEFAPIDSGETYYQSCFRVIGGKGMDIKDMMLGDGPLTHDIALRLSAKTGMSVDWWLNKEYEYRNAAFLNNLERQVEVYKLSQGVTQ